MWPVTAQKQSGASAATMINQVQYDAFGKVTSQTDAAQQPNFGFAGRDIEPVGGLTYNRNRYYNTSSGRFVSQDPIGFGGGDANLYRYVGNSPTMATDPSGLVVVVVHGIASQNEKEIAEITKTFNERWDALGVPRQEVVHFFYGVGEAQKPFGVMNANNDTWNGRNQAAGKELLAMLDDLRYPVRMNMGSQRPPSTEEITVIAYSNGSNLAWLAAKENQETRTKIDQLIIVGGSLDQDNDMSVLNRLYKSVVNIWSPEDRGVTGIVDGIGGQGLHAEDRKRDFMREIEVEDVFHSWGQVLNWRFFYRNPSEPWAREGRIHAPRYGYGDVTSWLSRYMATDYYFGLLGQSGNAWLSNTKAEKRGQHAQWWQPDTTDDKPLRYDCKVR